MRRLLVPIALVVAAACGTGSDTGGDTPDDTSGDSAGDVTPTEPLPSDVERSPVDPGAPVEALSEGFNDAGFDLLRAQPAEANLVLSPLSIGHAVLMLRGAADEPTGAAIDVAFALPDGDEAHRAWNALDADLLASTGVATAVDDEPSPVLELAGRVWPDQRTAPDQAWLDLLAAEHGAAVETIDVTDAERSTERINDWVGEQTNGLIPSLLPPGFIDQSTLLVLTDAVYFKAQWQNLLIKYGPESGTFTRLDGSTVDIEYLVDLEQPGPRGRGDGYSGASLPYLGGDYSMLLIIPEEGRFEEIRGRLSTDFLDEVDAAFSPGPYELWMPEWETKTDLDLLDHLTEAGVAPGHYPGVAEGSFLGGAVHGADITVDEIGTVAAAATGLGVLESGPPEPELTITADKPFFYVVRHAPTGTVLFAGQVTDPTS